MVSVTRVLSGDAYNVIPQTATLSGTVRVMKRETMTQIEQAMQRISHGVATGFGASAEVDFRLIGNAGGDGLAVLAQSGAGHTRSPL